MRPQLNIIGHLNYTTSIQPSHPSTNNMEASITLIISRMNNVTILFHMTYQVRALPCLVSQKIHLAVKDRVEF
jgi:hypothetical protein